MTKAKTPDRLQTIVALAKLQLEQERAVTVATDALAAAKDALRRTAEEHLPNAMEELGLTELKLTDGSVVTVASKVQCAITEARRAAAHDWLRDHGFGGLIKTAVSVAMERGDDEDALALAARLGDEGYPAAIVSAVHPSTLRAFVAEQLAAGNNIPLELFGARPYEAATIKPPRAK